MAKCLLIDRDVAERKRVRDQLADIGLTVVERDDAAQGLVYCNDNEPDVVLMALHGATIQTEDFIRRMRKSSEGKRPVVIAYGPQSYASHIGQTILAGAAECFLLPADCDTISFKLRQTGVF